MSPVEFAIDYVINGPNEISDYMLQLAFDNRYIGFGSNIWGTESENYSVEQGIREKVINKMVGPLLNVAGGNTEVIDLTGARIKNISGGIVAVNVPAGLLGGRTITSVNRVYPGTLTTVLGTMSGSGGPMSPSGVSGSSAVSGLGRLLNNIDDRNVISPFTDISMTGKNSFIIRGVGTAMFNMVAVCVMSYDDHFSMLPPKMYDKFAELVTLGCKAYIYKHCRRGLQEAVQRFGVSLDELQDEISSYSDAHKEFKDYFEEEIRKVLAYADQKGAADTIKFMVPRKR